MSLDPKRLAPVVLAVALAACSQSKGGVVMLGAAGPWRDVNGAANRKGVELALEEINGAADARYRFDVQFRDDSASGVKAAAIAQEFVSDPRVVGVVGHLNSGAMIAAAKIYDGHLPAIATAATSPGLTGISRWAFRVIASDSMTGLRIADFESKRGHKRAAVLYENNAYGRGLADSFRRGFPGQIISFDPVSDRQGEDLEPFVTSFKQQHADVIFVAGTFNSGLAFLKEARRQQVTADLVGGNGWASVANNPLADGAFFPTPFNPADSRAEVKAFVAAYQKKFGEVPTPYAALAYDATKLLAAAVAKVGPDRAKIRDYLSDLSPAYRGITGPIVFGGDGDPKDKGMTMVRIQKGALEAEGTP
jgi:branched-chain amino acid transport system substrate-binding protein